MVLGGNWSEEPQPPPSQLAFPFLPSLCPCCSPYPSPPLPSPVPHFSSPTFASSYLQAQAEAKREHEGAVQLLEVGSLEVATSNTSLGGRQGSSERAVMDCMGVGGCGVKEGPLSAPEPRESLPLSAYFSGGGAAGQGLLGLVAAAPTAPTPRGCLHPEISFHLGTAQSVQGADQVVSTWALAPSLPLCAVTRGVKGSNLSCVLSFPATVDPGFHAGTAS